MGLLRLDLHDFRNIPEASVELSAGLNVFVGANAQGKTSLLEAVGLLARGRSFRTNDTRTLIRRGSEALSVRGLSSREPTRDLRVSLDSSRRRFSVDGRDVTPGIYRGQLDVVVYATDRLPVVRGPMRERRQFIDRSAAALWASYRQLLHDYERIVRQRNVVLERGSRGLEAWDDALITVGARLRQRRGTYVQSLGKALSGGPPLADETYAITTSPVAPVATDEDAARALQQAVVDRRPDEQRARRSLVGPHRDEIFLTIDGVDAANGASAGQARTLLLALTLASIEVHRQEHGHPPVALLDDLDSELDDARAGALCRVLAQHGQALVTTAHEPWARRVASDARTFQVADGRFTPA